VPQPETPLSATRARLYTPTVNAGDLASRPWEELWLEISHSACLADINLVMDAQARFDALYREQAGEVRRYVRRRWDAQSADDVVADVFVVAWRRLADVPDDPLPWLLGVARRVLANRRRGDARDQALRGRIRSEQLRATATGEADASRGGEAVWVALSILSERDREALLLVAWEGLSTARAARVVGVRANTFAVRLYRARRRFAHALRTQTNDPGQRPGSTNTEVLR
jgi:RNA polymerase sigma-70 factor (ECF subfamily)